MAVHSFLITLPEDIAASLDKDAAAAGQSRGGFIRLILAERYGHEYDQPSSNETPKEFVRLLIWYKDLPGAQDAWPAIGKLAKTTHYRIDSYITKYQNTKYFGDRDPVGGRHKTSGARKACRALLEIERRLGLLDQVTILDVLQTTNEVARSLK